MIIRFLPVFLLSAVIANSPLLAQTPVSTPPIKNSAAFLQFENRPVSELSKLLYLVDRLQEVGIKVITYEGRNYSPAIVTGLARWYLARHYERESAERWLSKWCFQGRKSGQPVWIQKADGTRMKAKEMLLDELEWLEATSSKV